MRLLYLGSEDGTSLQRANALRRLGHEVRIFDESRNLPGGRIMPRIHYETGGVFLQNTIQRRVLDQVGGERFDAVWVDHGRLVGPRFVKEMQRRWGPVINYNADDPYGPRDRKAWLTYLQAIRENDLTVVVREPNVAEAKALGARRVERIYRLADEVAHAPRALTDAQRAEFGAQVAFAGTCFEDRSRFMADIVERGVPLSLRGDHYDRTPDWPTIQPHWKGPGTKTDDDYAAVILGAQVTLGLLSAKNRDEHTSRSLEIPYMGGLFCAKRTPEHLGLYEEGEEALFWDDPAECAEVCRRILADPERGREIARRGRERALRNGHTNEPTLRRLLEMVTT